MTAAFHIKKLSSKPRVCHNLRALRLERNVSLEQLSEYTHIEVRFLQALEECRFEDIPGGDVYRRNMLLRYARALSLDEQSLLAQYQQEEQPKKIKEPNPIRTPRTINIPIILRRALIAGVMLTLASYLFLQLRGMNRPPSLAIFTPPDGFITIDPTITIQGKTERETQVEINGERILIHEDGSFAQPIELKEGVNTILVRAITKHEKETNITRHVVFDPNADEKISRAR